MSQGTLYELVSAMASQIRDAVHADEFPVQVEAGYLVNPTPPAIDVFAADPFRDDDGAGMGDESGVYLFTVRARVSGDVDAQQQLLWDLMDSASDLSVAQALTEDPTLNGFADDLEVDGFSGMQSFGDHVGVTWDVRVARAYS